MSFHEYPNQQELACLPASRPAEADLCIVFRGPPSALQIVDPLSETVDLLPSDAELIPYYEVAYSCDVHDGPELLQLPVCSSPNVHP